jgi:hypothetical protein
MRPEKGHGKRELPLSLDKNCFGKIVLTKPKKEWK